MYQETKIQFCENDTKTNAQAINSVAFSHAGADGPPLHESSLVSQAFVTPRVAARNASVLL